MVSGWVRPKQEWGLDGFGLEEVRGELERKEPGCTGVDIR